MVHSNPILISFDIEDWLQSTWDRTLPISKVSYENTSKLLDILDEHKVKATMFILGKFANKYPEIIKRMHNEGHEIACHGFNHIEIFNQSKIEFKNDVYKTKNLLEDLIGSEINGYRAPDFSITKDSLWALDILIELGFMYDSSIFPIKHNRYGIKDWPLTICKVKTNRNKSSILEVPLSTVALKSYNIPVSGGGYFRLFPKFLFSLFAKTVLKTRPFIYYGHPYEINPYELSKIKHQIPIKYKIHQNLGRKFVKGRLKALFNNFDTDTIFGYINSRLANFPTRDLYNQNI